MSQSEVSELDQIILDARATDYGLDKLIEENKSYVQSRVLRYAPNTDLFERDDLYSIALLAFYEAVRAYSPDKGHFYPFADVVLHRRLIDELRRSSRSDAELVILDNIEEESGESIPIQSASLDNYERDSENSALQLEVEQFVAELEAMGITLASLEKRSPKHAALKKVYLEILRKIKDDDEVKKAIFVKHYYPIKKISEITQISPKKLERSRIYIIAAMLIICGDYSRLAEYIPIEEVI